MINTPQTFTEKVRLYHMVVGTLGHDNKLFDRSCPQCAGWYSSAEHANCPKCGAVLNFITTKEGKRMTISEGTVYPILGDRGKKDEEQTRLRKNGLLPIYRFKMFSFANPAEALVLPAAHMHCRRGAVVKVSNVNHQPIYSYFEGKKGHYVEILMAIYPGFGDEIKLIQEPKAVAQYEDRVPQDMPPEQELAWLKERIDILQAQQAGPVEHHAPPAQMEMNLDPSYIAPESEAAPLFDGGDADAAHAENVQEVLGPETVSATVNPFGMK